jgi:glycosyltransferase involved in cell wall biosynthesis
MRVLSVGPYPPSEDTISLRVRAWCAELAKSYPSVQIRVVAARESGECLFNASATSNAIPGLTIVRTWRRDSPSQEILRAIREQEQEFVPDLIHVHFNYYTFGGMRKSLRVLSRVLDESRRRKIPTVVTLHSVVASPARYLITRTGDGSVPLPIPFESVVARLGGLLLGTILTSANKVVVTSRRAEDWTEQNVPVGPGVLAYIPLGALPSPSPTELASNAAGAKGEGKPPLVTFLGRLAPYKGVDVLIRAVKELRASGREVRLRIFGSVGDRMRKPEAFQQRLTELAGSNHDGLVVFDSRFVPQAEYEALTAATDVFALPFRDDGVISASGSVLDLGMSSQGRLVLTTVPRLSEYSSIRGSFRCPPENASALADSIWRAARAPPVDLPLRRKEMDGLSTHAVAERYHELYEFVVHAASSPVARDPRAPRSSSRFTSVAHAITLPKRGSESESPAGAVRSWSFPGSRGGPTEEH